MTKLLLDTNVLIWTIYNSKLSSKHLRLLAEAQDVFISPLSILEIRIKQELGKLPDFDIVHNIEVMDMTILPFESTHARSYNLHSQSNKDPFDNALISIALAENLTFMTSDKRVLELKIKGFKTINVG